MARKKMADGTEVEVPDTIITDAEPVVQAPAADPVVEADEAPELTEQTKAEMAEGRRLLAERSKVAADLAARLAADESTAKGQ